MKTLLIYRPNSEHERQALDYLRDFKMQTGKDLQTLDADSPQGADTCRLYEIMDYPAILVTADDGAMQNLWVRNLPRINELTYYVSDK